MKKLIHAALAAILLILAPTAALADKVTPITRGGTGSATQNFVDLTTAQAVAGIKTFSSAPTLSAGANSAGALTFTATNQSVKITNNTHQFFIGDNGYSGYIQFPGNNAGGGDDGSVIIKSKYDSAVGSNANIKLATYDGTTSTDLLVADRLGNVTVPGTFALGGGTALTKVVVYTPSLTPAAVAANTSAEQTFTVNGLSTSDTVIVNPPSGTDGLLIGGVRASAANTLAVRWANVTAGALTPAAGTFRVVAIRN